MKKKIVITPEISGTRLDLFLASEFRSLSRTRIKRLVDQGLVSVNNTVKKGSFRLKSGDIVRISVPEKKEFRLKPFDFTVPVIFEDSSLIVVNKPEDLTVHPPNENYHRTLVNALTYMGKTLAPVNSLRPGVVHRLDKETSGLLVLAKTMESYYGLTAQFKNRTVYKEYRALVWGLLPQDRLKVDMPISRDSSNRMRMKVRFLNAKNALTEITVIDRLALSTYLSLHLVTGRMHQIRVHLKFLGYPLVGDKKYGKKDDFDHLMLHAHKLSFTHPATGKTMEFKARTPDYFREFIKKHETD